MPTADEIDDPAALVTRLRARARGEEPPRDAMDDALEALLTAAADGPSHEGASGDDAADPGDSASDPGDDAPGGPRPV